MAYGTEKKILIPFYIRVLILSSEVWEKIFTYTKSPTLQIKSQMVGVKVYNNVLSMTKKQHTRPVLNNILPLYRPYFRPQKIF